MRVSLSERGQTNSASRDTECSRCAGRTDPERSFGTPRGLVSDAMSLVIVE